LLPIDGDNFNYFQILQHAVIAFLCAFAKEFSDSVHKKESFLLFLTDFILSGVCGSLIGLVAIEYIESPYISLFIAGAGAFLGSKGLEAVIKVVFQKYLNVTIDSKNKEKKEEDEG